MQHTTEQHKLLVRDSDGNWYSIPGSLNEDFKIMKESLIELEAGTDEWFEASNALSTLFEEYKV